MADDERSPASYLMELKQLARDGCAEEFFERTSADQVVELAGRAGELDGSVNVLWAALRNTSVPDRVEIATALLDAGHPVVTGDHGTNEFIVLFDRSLDRDITLETPLVEKLLTAGVNPNNIERRGDRPLLQLMTIDEDAAPWVDLLLADPRVDLLREDRKGRSVWSIAQRDREHYPWFEQRVRAVVGQ